MLKRLVLILALLPAAAAAAPWQLAPATTVAVDVAWQGRTVPVRFPTLAGQIDFDEDHPERAKADDQRRRPPTPPPAWRSSTSCSAAATTSTPPVSGDHLPASTS